MLKNRRFEALLSEQAVSEGFDLSTTESITRVVLEGFAAVLAHKSRSPGSSGTDSRKHGLWIKPGQGNSAQQLSRGVFFQGLRALRIAAITRKRRASPWIRSRSNGHRQLKDVCAPGRWVSRGGVEKLPCASRGARARGVGCSHVHALRKGPLLFVKYFLCC